MLGKRGGASYLRCAGFKLGDKMADESYCTVQTAEGKVRGLWRDENGREVQLAPRGDMVPDLFIHILSGQLETQGICTRRYFKRRLREI